MAIFVACAFPIHIWAVIGMLNQIPAWLTRSARLWDLSGLIGVTLLFTLLESLIITLVVLLVLGLVPTRWFSEKTIIYSVIILWLTAIASIIAHFAGPSIRSYWALIIAILYLVAVGAAIWSAHRYSRVGSGLNRLLERLTILTAFYLFFDLVAVAIVVIRNI